MPNLQVAGEHLPGERLVAGCAGVLIGRGQRRGPDTGQHFAGEELVEQRRQRLRAGGRHRLRDPSQELLVQLRHPVLQPLPRQQPELGQRRFLPGSRLLDEQRAMG